MTGRLASEHDVGTGYEAAIWTYRVATFWTGIVVETSETVDLLYIPPRTVLTPRAKVHTTAVMPISGNVHHVHCGITVVLVREPVVEVGLIKGSNTVAEAVRVVAL